MFKCLITGDSEAKTIPHISTEVSSPNSKRLKLDFVNVLQPGCMVESSSYIDSGPSEERRGDGSSLSVSHDYDNSNQDTAAELGESFICEEKKDISTFLLSRDWLVI